MKMSKKTFERLTQKLIREIECHKHKDELITLITHQLLDSDEIEPVLPREKSQFQHGTRLSPFTQSLMCDYGSFLV